MQINDYKDKDRCQRWDKDGWLRSRSIPDELSYLRNTDTISQCWRFPFPSTFSICKLPKKVHFSMFSPLNFTSIHGCSFHSVRSLSGRQRNTRSRMTYDVYLMRFEKCWNVHTEKYYTSFNAIQTKFFARSNIAKYHFCWESAIASKFLPADLFHVISLLRGNLPQD